MLTKKKTAAAKLAGPVTPAAPNRTQSRHFKPRNGLSGSPATRAVQMFHRLAIDGVRALPVRDVEKVECAIYRWRGDKLVVVRSVERPRTLASGYRGRISLSKAREGDFGLLDELFDYAVDSDGFQAPESILRELLQEWMRLHGDRLSGNDRLSVARAFSMVMAARHGADIATVAGLA